MIHREKSIWKDVFWKRLKLWTYDTVLLHHALSYSIKFSVTFNLHLYTLLLFLLAPLWPILPCARQCCNMCSWTWAWKLELYHLCAYVYLASGIVHASTVCLRPYQCRAHPWWKYVFGKNRLQMLPQVIWNSHVYQPGDRAQIMLRKNVAVSIAVSIEDTHILWSEPDS